MEIRKYLFSSLLLYLLSPCPFSILQNLQDYNIASFPSFSKTLISPVLISSLFCNVSLQSLRMTAPILSAAAQSRIPLISLSTPSLNPRPFVPFTTLSTSLCQCCPYTVYLRFKLHVCVFDEIVILDPLYSSLSLLYANLYSFVLITRFIIPLSVLTSVYLVFRLHVFVAIVILDLLYSSSLCVNPYSFVFIFILS